MHITLHSSHQYFGSTCILFIDCACFYMCLPARFFLCLNEREQVRHALLHHTCTLYYLRQEHFSAAKQVAHYVHTIHQRTFYHVQWLRIFCASLFCICVYIVSDAVYQCMFQPFFNRCAAPCVIYFYLFALRLHRICKDNQLFRCFRIAIEYHIFAQLFQFRFYLIINNQRAGVYDTHIHTGLNSVIQEHTVHRLTHRLISTERERHITYTTAYFCQRHLLLYYPCSFYEVYSVIIMFFYTGSYREDVQIEDDILRRETYLLCEYLVCPF